MNIKQSHFAGSFYPAGKTELQSMIDGFISGSSDPAGAAGELGGSGTPGQERQASAAGQVGAAGESGVVGQETPGSLKAIIAPHAGYVYSGQTAGFVYKAVKEQAGVIKKVIVIGPSHRFWFRGVAVCDHPEWETPLGKIKIAPELAEDINFEVNDQAFNDEHSVEVQLPFLQTVLPDFTLYPFITGEVTEHAVVAENIKKYIDENTLLVISSDLSHYHPYEKAEILDEQTAGEIISLKGIISHDQACGADGINILMHLAREMDWKPVLLDARNSGDTAGDKSSVVGYSAISFVKY
jgi:hypothetical protein